jgi:hypothetical protein
MELIDVLDQGNRVLKPKAILAAYDNYIELAIVQNNEIGAFSPLTKIAIDKLIQVSSPDTSVMSVGGLIPKNVTFVSFSITGATIAFKVKPQSRTIFIEGGTMRIQSPDLLMVIRNGDFYVYSYKGYLTEKTMLYKAPFSNFTGKNAVCFGNIRIKPHQVIKDIIKEYESAYWNSQFEMTNKEATKYLANNWKKDNKEEHYGLLIDKYETTFN